MNDPLYPFIKDNKIGRGWKEIKETSWWTVVIALSLIILPVVVAIVEKIIEWAK